MASKRDLMRLAKLSVLEAKAKADERLKQRLDSQKDPGPIETKYVALCDELNRRLREVAQKFIAKKGLQTSTKTRWDLSDQPSPQKAIMSWYEFETSFLDGKDAIYTLICEEKNQPYTEYRKTVAALDKALQDFEKQVILSNASDESKTMFESFQKTLQDILG